MNLQKVWRSVVGNVLYIAPSNIFLNPYAAGGEFVQ